MAEESTISHFRKVQTEKYLSVPFVLPMCASKEETFQIWDIIFIRELNTCLLVQNLTLRLIYEVSSEETIRETEQENLFQKLQWALKSHNTHTSFISKIIQQYPEDLNSQEMISELRIKEFLENWRILQDVLLHEYKRVLEELLKDEKRN